MENGGGSLGRGWKQDLAFEPKKYGTQAEVASKTNIPPMVSVFNFLYDVTSRTSQPNMYID